MTIRQFIDDILWFATSFGSQKIKFNKNNMLRNVCICSSQNYGDRHKIGLPSALFLGTMAPPGASAGKQKEKSP